MADWEKLRHKYITGSNDVTYRSLAKKYRVKAGTVCTHAANGGWTELREAYRGEAKRAAIEGALQERIPNMVDGTIEEYTIYDQFIAKGLADLTGSYPEGVDPDKGQKIPPATLLTAIRDRRKLREWVHGDEPVPDAVSIVKHYNPAFSGDDDG